MVSSLELFAHKLTEIVFTALPEVKIRILLKTDEPEPIINTKHFLKFRFKILILNKEMIICLTAFNRVEKLKKLVIILFKKDLSRVCNKVRVINRSSSFLHQ